MEYFFLLPHHTLCKCEQCFPRNYDNSALVSTQEKVNRDGDICDLKCVSYEQGSIQVYYTVDNPNASRFGDCIMTLEEWNALKEYGGE